MWQIRLPSIAVAGQDSPPLQVGSSGVPCAKCDKIGLCEWSPGRYRACSQVCLARQHPGQTVEALVSQRHGVDLMEVLRGL